VKKAVLALAVAIAAGIVGASQLLATPTRSAATTITVDQGSQQCSGVNNAYKGHDAINVAVAAASDGSTIKVCPGNYDPVVVTKKLTFTGTSVTATTAAQCITPASWPATDTTKFAVVDDSSTSHATTNPGFSVDGVDGVVIQGFTIQGRSSGIHTTAATDSLAIVSNVIQNNTIGVYLNGGQSDPTKNKVQKSCIRRNSMDGSASGSGIYSEHDLYFGKIEKNTFYRNNNSGEGGAINLAAGNIEDVQILNNTANGDANFVSVTGSLRLNVNANSTTGILGGAVFLDGGNVDTQITGNTFNAGHDDGVGINADGGGANDHVLIYGNTVTGNATDGIDTGDDGALTHSSIGTNTVKTNGDRGIALFHNNNSQNFVTGNTVTGNGVATSDNCVDTNKVLFHNTWYSNGSDCKP
jgi:hypothetical protein